MALTILHIRGLQLFRILRDIGWVYLLIFLPIAFVGLLVLLETARDHPGWLGFGGCIILLSLHVQRKDKSFLSFLNTPTHLFCATEYSGAVLPLSLLLLAILQDWQDALILQVGAIIIAMLPLGIRRAQLSGGSYKLGWLPMEAIEWKSGFRRYGWFILLIYLAALPMAIYTATVPVVMLVFAMVATSFYDDIEGKELLETMTVNKSLLLQKMKMQLIAFHLLLLPLYLLFLIFHHTYWYILLAVLLIVQLLLCFSLFYKYANYAPFRQKLYNQTPVGIVFLCLLIPVFWPGVLIYCVFYYRKAINNMQFYYAKN